ncbi:hybrid sensor histidine kinase/response regulator [Pseudoduganella namucuonensis]|uniref:histidine kinase n=1 Tax=Pseudoduganella namucuonensis TaxID=1035707 RepID=A0A1I7ITI4_9BURK|nr:response regulator [Pseudoduganella namucuonensis]SFU76229.1 PAS domain S-box-containing protein [Pseudoduganella namucuonensis]
MNAPSMTPHGYQPHGGGRTGQLVRDFDWSATSLGPASHWSAALRTAVDIVLNSPVPMVLMWGGEHVMIYNDGYAGIAGARHPAALGGTVPAVWPELWYWNSAILEAGLRGEVRSVEEQEMTTLRNGAEELVWFDLHYTPVYDSCGAVGGVLCTVNEATARVLRRRELAQAGREPRHTAEPPRVAGGGATGRAVTEELLRMAQEAGGIGSFEWFPATGRMVVSATYRRLWGFADDVEVTAELLLGMIDERDRRRAGPMRMDRHNPLEYTEFRIRRADTGEQRWLARQGEGVGDDEGRRYVGVSFDITVRKQTEQALRASQDRLAAIFGQASVGLSELDLTGRFRRVNGALCHMLGRAEQALLGLHMDDIIHPEELEENRALVRRLLATGVPFTLEKRYLRPDGGWVWISSSMSRLDDEGGQPQALIAVKTDITERRRIEVALRDLNDTLEQRVGREVEERGKAEEALRQSQKMEAVGQLTGGVAHDFNNVLQIISGNLHLMQQQAAQQARPDPAMQKRLEMAVAAVERGARLSAQLLAFARRQPLQPIVSNLGRLVSNMDDLLRRTLGETIEVATIIGSGLWNALVDPGQIENVVLNLAINARDAMRGGGRLSIEVGNAVLDEYYVNNLLDVPAGQYVMLSVTDTGHGMEPEVLRRAFEPFFTTKPEGEGTGLGLSMAYGFVKQSRGHIKIHSEPGNGTSVRIYLPRAMTDEAQEPERRTGPVTGGSETILVVEDDGGVRSVVLDMLSGLGYRVLQAADGEAALRILEREAIELLFTDVVMPGRLSSPDLARAARALQPDIAVLFTSGYPQNAIVHEGRLDAGLELLSKPYRRDELARKLRHVLNNRGQEMLARRLRAEPVGDLLPPEPAIARDSSLRILVVEDNLDSQQMVCELIGMLGHTVHGVGDGEQAWAQLRAHDFDILFTDISLPGMSGIDLARKLLAEGKPTRVIFSTGYGKEALDGLEFPAGVLRKPYDLMELKAALDNP